MTETVAVLPARGGSKGVPRKNLRRVGGLPLVARAIRAAQAAPSIDRVVVSTDDDEIAATANEFGADVVRRPAALADDGASSEVALLHALDALHADGISVGVLAFLQCTSPFIEVSALEQAVALVSRGDLDSAFAAVGTYGFLWGASSTGVVRGLNHDPAHRPRRQDREPHYLETGAFYVLDAAGFRRARHRFFGRIGAVEVSERTAIEIDTEEHLILARAIAPLIDADDEAIDVDAVVTDFDGVHTDDTALVDADGREQVRVSRADGMGIARLRRAGVPVLILSTETNPVVTARARKLGVDVRQGVDDKSAVLQEWAAERGIALSRIAYLGNDLNDLACLEAIGWPVAVPDAHPLVLAEARVVVRRPGGDGAVRDLCERVLSARQRTTQEHDRLATAAAIERNSE